MVFATPQPGDLFFWKRQDGNIYHTGIVKYITQDGKILIIDAQVRMGVVEGRDFSISGPFWKSNIAGYGRPIE